ncbi:MAG TPA: aminotransferase class I/II-fold pyridoxal phosphate-dependent enzyme, partial [Anaerolineae bacterium]|nr:aminotransferase class I/II-fold pyridoxal phosphate-dependent enzyme [Anaerolineae bacterium]
MGEEASTIFTQAVHAGEEKRKPYHSLTMPIVQTSTYVFEDSAALIEHMERKMTFKELEREEYGRYGNPTQSTVERKLAELEGGEAALLFASGMCAITSTLLTMLSAGSHMILTDDCYRRTRQFCLTFLKRFDIEATIVPMGDYQALEAAIRENTRLILSETPTNPYLRVLDLPRVVEIARRHRLKTIVDSTFATPCNLRPLQFGVDLVIHSATKYLGGHNDLLAGVVIGPTPIIAALKEAQAMLGGIADPHNAYLLLRGLKTLAIRVAKQNENGLKVAHFLESHPKVKRVYYPGLPSHPDHELACQQMAGFGGVVSFELDGDLERTSAFIDALRIPYMGPSLGGVESIIEQSALMSH